jgi:lysozyme
MGVADDVRVRALAWLARQSAAPAQPPPPPQPAPAASPKALATPEIVQSAQPVDLAVATAAALCRRFEGFYSKPYLCPAGIPTIGYGATYYEDGRRVTLRDPAITRERAEALLLWHVRTVYLPAVRRLCPAVDHPGRLAALIDFAFNLGTGRLQASTLRQRVNAGRWGDVPAELRKWVMGGGRVLRGLQLRREAEIEVLG